MKNPLFLILLPCVLIACHDAHADNRQRTTDTRVPAGTRETPRDALADPDSVVVTAGPGRVTARLALSSAARSRGLGGVTQLATDAGMLFIYRNMDFRSYWMKDCAIGLDIFYLADDGAILAVRTMDAPAPGTPDSALPLFASPSPCRCVFELGAGEAARRGLVAGATIGLGPGLVARLAPLADP